MKRFSKIALIICFFIIGILFIGLIAPLFLNDYVEKRIEQEVSNQDSDYDLNIKEVSIGIWSGTFEADSIVISSKNDTLNLASFTSKSITISGINWFSLLGNSTPNFDKVNINKPSIVVKTRDLQFKNVSMSNSSSSDSGSIQLPNFDLEIVNGDAKVVHPDSTILLSIKDINLDAHQLRPSSLQKDSTDAVIDHFNFSTSKISGQLVEQLYQFEIGSLNINSDDKFAELNALKLNSLLPKYEFSTARGKQLDRLQIDISNIHLKGFNVDSIIAGTMNIDSIIVDEAYLEVFRNKQIPRSASETVKPMVNDMAKSIPIPLEITTIQVNNSEIVYGEHRPPSDTSASISFNKLNGTINHFRSANHPQFYDDTLKFHAETYFMNSSLLTVDVAYPVFNENDLHFLKAKLDSINPKVVQDMLMYVGFLKINDGMVHGLETEFTLNDSSSSGEVILLYSNLDISLVNKDDPDKRGIKEAITDFITDNFVIQSKNTAEDPRVGEISFEREKGKSVFAYWWKSLLSGIKDTIK